MPKRKIKLRSADVSQTAREWIMFLVAIGIVIYFALRGSELSAWWLLLLGSMLGLSVLVAGLSKTLLQDEEDEEADSA